MTTFTAMAIDATALMQPAEILLVVPPFARLDMPNPGVHLLQAAARERGYEVSVFYAGMWLAREIGEPLYQSLNANLFADLLVGERIFARAAYDVPLLGRGDEAPVDLRVREIAARRSVAVDLALLERLAIFVEGWCDRVAAAIDPLARELVGFTSMFDQTAACVALLRRLKALRPDRPCVVGGANCAGVMAEGMASLSAQIDHVFSGESEQVFVEFLEAREAGRAIEDRIIHGRQRIDMDALPIPDYADYYTQLDHCLDEASLPREEVMLPLETSRGCWWGHKHRCSFCGIHRTSYRAKSAQRVLDELRELIAAHPSPQVFTTDDIMAVEYYRTLLPRIATELPGLSLFWELKANMSLAQFRTLQAAGVRMILPGIEALSSVLLRRMSKGVLARQNIAALRYARSTLVYAGWVLLHGFPHDSAADYADYLELLPRLIHLNPPTAWRAVSILRFSPYYERAEELGVRSVRPIPTYRAVLPTDADHHNTAYFFEADYPSVVDEAPELVAEITRLVEAWQQRWQGPNIPLFEVRSLAPGLFVVEDTRGLASNPRIQPITEARAAALLVERPLSDDAEELAWARSIGGAVALDEHHVPLATADPELLAYFQREYGTAHATRLPILGPSHIDPS